METNNVFAQTRTALCCLGLSDEISSNQTWFAGESLVHPLWSFNIGIEHGHRNGEFSCKKCDYPQLSLFTRGWYSQRVFHSTVKKSQRLAANLYQVLVFSSHELDDERSYKQLSSFSTSGCVLRGQPTWFPAEERRGPSQSEPVNGRCENVTRLRGERWGVQDGAIVDGGMLV